MASNKKPRKKYRPKGVIADPIRYLIAGNKPADKAAIDKLKISYHMAMVNVTQGRGTKADWQELANTINLALMLCEMGYGKEYVQDIVQAQAAMTVLRDRFKATGKLILRSEEMRAINEALDLHDQQVEITPIIDMERGILAVERELARGNFVRVAPAQAVSPSASR